MCQTKAKYQTWSSDVSDGVGVTDMATAAVGIAEKDYHKVVVSGCLFTHFGIVVVRSRFLQIQNAHQGHCLEV